VTEYSIDIKVEALIGDEPAEALLTVLNDLEYGPTVAFESFYTAVLTVEASSPVGGGVRGL